jgi:peptide/nickel transport system substrate-binding protein
MRDADDSRESSRVGINKAPAFSRRAILKGAAASAASGLVVATVGACGSSASSGISSGGPRRGGRLRVGVTGGASSDTLDAQNGINPIDFVRIPQLNEPLINFNHRSQLVMWLAEEITPNSDATEWVVRVKDGITWHDGKPLSSADVIYSFQRILNPKHPLGGAASLASLDLNGMKVLDARTCRLSCHAPFATFPEVLPSGYSFIVPVGYNPRKPIGTGPFKFESFTPGVQSVFVRNDNYWMTGKPYLDSVVITDYSDPTSQVNALLAYDIDTATVDSNSVISELQAAGLHVIVSDTGFMTPFTMRTDIPPFNDVRVRQAMRLCVDRPEMLRSVFAGAGSIGNDISSPYDSSYDHALPQRVQDIPQAKSLLKQAGHGDGLTVQLTTGNISPGTLLASQVLAQQASAAGFKVQLDQLTPTAFFGSNFLHWDFALDYFSYLPYLVQCSLSLIGSAPFNETHFHNAKYDQLYAQALRTPSLTARTPIIHDMMTIDYEEGGYIIPYFIPAVNAYGPKLRGGVPDSTGVTDANADFRDLWFE